MQKIEFTPQEMKLIQSMGFGGPSLHAECASLAKEYQANPSMELSTGQYGMLKLMKRNAAYKVVMDV